MKKFSFTIRGNKYEVELQNLEDNIAEIEVNGSKYEVEIHQEIKTPKVIPTAEPEAVKTAKPTARKGTGGLNAPLPGTVLEIKVKVGDEVKAGDLILVMEAMKMENNIKADKNGKISAIKVNVGDSVLEGDLLVEIGS